MEQRRPQPLTKSLRYLPQPSTPSRIDQCKPSSKRQQKSLNIEDIPRPVPPLPLSRTVGFEVSSSAQRRVPSVVSISSATSSGKHVTPSYEASPSSRPSLETGVEPSPWQSNSSAVTRSSLAYSIVHHNRSSSRSNREGSAPSVSAAVTSLVSVSTPSNSKRRRSGKRSSLTELAPSPSPSRHSGNRGSAARTSLFQSVPKPFWLQSLVSSDVSEEEPETVERKVTDCGPLLVPRTDPPAAVSSDEPSPESAPEDASVSCLPVSRERAAPRPRRASVMVGDYHDFRRTLSPNFSASLRATPPETPSLATARCRTNRPVSQARRGSVIQSPCLSPSVSPSPSLVGGGGDKSGAQTARRAVCRVSEPFTSPSPRRSAPGPAKQPRVPAKPSRTVDRLGSTDLHSPSPSPLPRRSSVSLPRDEWRASDASLGSDRLAEIFAQLVDKSQQLRSMQPRDAASGVPSLRDGVSSLRDGIASLRDGVSAVGSGCLSARGVCSPSESATALTARLSEASTSDKTIKTTARTAELRSALTETRFSGGDGRYRDGDMRFSGDARYSADKYSGDTRYSGDSRYNADARFSGDIVLLRDVRSSGDMLLRDARSSGDMLRYAAGDGGRYSGDARPYGDGARFGQRSTTRLGAPSDFSPGPSLRSLRPVGEPSIIDRVNNTRPRSNAKKRAQTRCVSGAERHSAPVSGADILDDAAAPQSPTNRSQSSRRRLCAARDVPQRTACLVLPPNNPRRDASRHAASHLRRQETETDLRRQRKSVLGEPETPPIFT